MLATAAMNARADGMAVMCARGRESERRLPFAAVVGLFEASWSDALTAAERAELAAGPARAAAELLDGRAPSGAPDGGFAIMRGLARLACRLAEAPPGAGERPRGLALVVDDLHDLDGPSLRFLAYLAARLDATPIAILGALRPGLPSEDPPALSAIATPARVIRTPPLTAAEVVARTRELLPDASPRFCAACAGASAGDPGLLGALLDELRRRDVAPSDGQAERIAELVPDSVRTDVGSRLARLPEPARALARAIAELGDGVSLDRACVASQLAEVDAPDALDALVTAELLAPGLPLGFVAPLVSRAVRASLTVGQRIALGRHLPGQLPRPRSALAPDAGIDSLTPSERRVGELGARGMTTKEIAATLFITTKTVEFHLRNVYRKLDVPSSRLELTRIMGRAAIVEALAEPVDE
jgi:DNA-binding CsgD family transcriptional regulator